MCVVFDDGCGLRLGEDGGVYAVLLMVISIWNWTSTYCDRFRWILIDWRGHGRA